MRRRYLILAGIIVACIVGLYYVFFVHDGTLNLYKKHMLKGYAEEYIRETYPETKIDDIDVSYDSAFKYYSVKCVCGDKTILLNYNGSFDLEYDNFYDEKYTAKVVKYQQDYENRLTEALNAAEIRFDAVSVAAELDSSVKNDIVKNNSEINNAKIECSVTLNRGKDEAIMNKYEIAEYVKTVADCVYSEVGDTAFITVLNLTYNYDTEGRATFSWNRRMENMSLYELSEEIKYN